MIDHVQMFMTILTNIDIHLIYGIIFVNINEVKLVYEVCDFYYIIIYIWYYIKYKRHIVKIFLKRSKGIGVTPCACCFFFYQTIIQKFISKCFRTDAESFYSPNYFVKNKYF